MGLPGPRLRHNFAFDSYGSCLLDARAEREEGNAMHRSDKCPRSAHHLALSTPKGCA